jgi:hypothetical protein
LIQRDHFQAELLGQGFKLARKLDPSLPRYSRGVFHRKASDPWLQSNRNRSRFQDHSIFPSKDAVQEPCVEGRRKFCMAVHPPKLVADLGGHIIK